MKLFSRPYSKRWMDFPAAALLFAALTTAVLRLIITEWTSDLDILEGLLLASVVFGFAFGYSRFSPVVTFFLTMIYAGFFINWQLASIVNEISSRITWIERLSIVYARLEIVFRQLVKDEFVTDSILFIYIMSIIIWTIGFISSYWLVRNGNAWISILPPGIFVLVIQYFDSIETSRIWYLGVFIFFSLMLVARMVFLHNKERWQENHTNLPPQLGIDFIRFSFFIASFIVILALWIPGISISISGLQKVINPIKNGWNQFQENMENVFASLKSSIGVSTDFYGMVLPLGRGNVLSEDIIFQANIRGALPKGVRLYWKVRSYHYYDGKQWISIAEPGIPWNPDNTQLTFPPMKQRWETEYSITSSTYFKTIISPSQPIWVNRKGEVDAFNNPDNTIDLISFRSILTIRPGITYYGQAALNQATIYDMRHSSVLYPEWTKQRYLQLPPTITERTRQLSIDITKGLENPYDKTVAIIQFLRNTYPYTEIVPEAPGNQDVVDWFLFDQREGFCNYYASAAVVMLRSLGIPARLSAGYATGEDLKEGNYVIHQKDAHAWPEIYFSDLGWVEFEPTASIPAIVRLPGEDPNRANSRNENEPVPLIPPTPVMDEGEMFPPFENSLRPRSGLSIVQWILLIIFFLISVMAITLVVLRKYEYITLPSFPIFIATIFKKIGIQPPAVIQQWIDLSLHPPIIKFYQEINKALHRLKLYPLVNDTPSERSARLVKVIPSLQQPCDDLTTQYHIAIFSTGTPDINKAERSSKEIRKRSLSIYLARLIQQIRNFGRKSRKIDQKFTYARHR